VNGFHPAPPTAELADDLPQIVARTEIRGAGADRVDPQHPMAFREFGEDMVVAGGGLVPVLAEGDDVLRRFQVSGVGCQVGSRERQRADSVDGLARPLAGARGYSAEAFATLA